MDATRNVGFAPNCITFSEIEAFSRITHARLSAWDVALIRRLDAAYLRVKAGLASPDAPAKPPPKRSFGDMMRDRFPSKAGKGRAE